MNVTPDDCGTCNTVVVVAVAVVTAVKAVMVVVVVVYMGKCLLLYNLITTKGLRVNLIGGKCVEDHCLRV